MTEYVAVLRRSAMFGGAVMAEEITDDPGVAHDIAHAWLGHYPGSRAEVRILGPEVDRDGEEVGS